MGVNFTEEQQAVIDARDANILVSAAAGSGKTAVLVERIIQMISSDMDIDHLLVVTFTKAAAAQMKEKITLAIQEKLLTDPDNKHLQKQETLIHNAQITTIDAFCQYVLRNNFNVIGLDPSFHVGDDGELRLLQEEVMKQLFEDEYALAKENGNEDFLYCMDYFSTGSNDKKVEEYIGELYRFSMSMPWPEDWIASRASDYDLGDRSFDQEEWVKDCVIYIKRSLKEASQKLDTAIRITNEPDGPYYYGDRFQIEKDSIDAALQYNTYDELFDRVRGITFDRLPGKKDPSVSEDKKEYAKSLRDEVKEIVKKLVENYLALPSETVVAQMKLCDRAVKELCRLTLEYKKRYDAKKREDQLIDFSDMEHFALQILVEHPGDTPSAVALEYRDYFKEVLIDEYQDSNNVQELILKSIAGEEAAKSERFMVGDVKQSIYKFRLARPEIFMDKLSSYDKEKGASNHRIDLHKNFRSRKEVLEITNYIFKKIMGTDLGGVAYDKDAELVTGADYPAETYGVTPELMLIDGEEVYDGSVDMTAYDAKEKEALAIAGRIHELMKEDPNLSFKDMVILLRSNAGWDDVFKNTLESQGIPTYIESKSGYFDAWEVSILLNLISIVDNPLQDIPLVSVMHSCIGGFSDEELASIRIAIDGDEELSDGDSFYRGIKGLVEKSEDSYPKLKTFVDMIEDFRERSVYTPVHELLQYIEDKTGFDSYITAMPAGEKRRANLELLLTNAANFEKTSFRGLFHFVRYIEHLKVVQVDYGEAGIIDENANVVRIMSIHKSKGLEFPVVFVAGLSKNFNRMDTKGDIVTDLDLGIGVKCVDTELRVKYDTLKRIMIADKMNTDSLGEELRVLYVALTRAKEKLIMTAYVKKLADTLIKAARNLPVIAESGELLPYSMRLSFSSYFDFILAALIRHPQVKELLSKYEISFDSVNAHFDDEKQVPAFTFKSLSDSDLAAIIESQGVTGVIRRAELESDADLEFDKDLSDRLKEKFSARYAFENLKGLFTKTTVTELKKHMLEQEGEVFTKDISQENAPVYETVEGKLSGAERGTAYHRIMELLDEDIYGNATLADLSRKEIAQEVEKWLTKKTTEKVIPSEYESAVNEWDVATFLLTDLGKRMGRAYRNNALMRERPFMMGIDAGRLDEKFPDGEMVLIQGIIDAFFVEEGEIVLLDYKTDKVSDETELVSRYRIQLDYYKEALEASTNMKVKEIYIYSFSLGKEIPLSLQ